MISLDTFKRLAIALRNTGEVVDKRIDNQFFKACVNNELTLVLTEHQRGWLPEGIIFQLFGEDFYLTPDGTISVTSNNSGDDESFYTLSDEALLATVSSFLNWRLKIIEKLEI